jgi:hypothetical protein
VHNSDETTARESMAVEINIAILRWRTGADVEVGRMVSGTCEKIANGQGIDINY